MRVGVIGYGFVGKALVNGLNSDVDVNIIDPLLKKEVEDLRTFNPEIIFICVPTPMNADGSQDISILHSVVKDVKSLNSNALVVLKSTVLPSHLSEIKNQFKSFVINPEFLKESSANEDFINPPMILFGGNKKDCERLSNFYAEYTKCKTQKHVSLDIKTASLIKYSINSFLATKVIFFNELKNIFDELDSQETWENFIEILSLDTRIGKSHMQVPGPDGKKGFGGACFPKDTNALHDYSMGIGKEFKLLKKAISVNNAIRSKYNDLDSREAEQNINFKDKN